MSIRALVLALVAASVLGGCGHSSPTGSPGPGVLWAQATTIHDGERTQHVPGYVRALRRAGHGFVVDVTDGPGLGLPQHTLLVDEHGAATRAPGRPRDVHVSPDGRYAGWIDLDGPQGRGGRLPQVVVTDLRTGRVVLRNHEHLGRRAVRPDSLWDDGFVRFLGFDAGHAYWTTPGGPGGTTRTWAARLGTWRPEAVHGVVRTLDPALGRRVMLDADGRVTSAAAATASEGIASPDGRWCLDVSVADRLPATRCRTGARATPRYPREDVSFGGWLGNDEYVVLARSQDDGVVDPASRDDSTGVLATCSLTSRRCRVVQKVTHTDTVVLPTGEPIA